MSTFSTCGFSSLSLLLMQEREKPEGRPRGAWPWPWLGAQVMRIDADHGGRVGPPKP